MQLSNEIMQSLHTYTYVKSKSSSIVIMRRECWTPLSLPLSTPSQHQTKASVICSCRYAGRRPG
jgi:hypothetical protein